MHAPPRKLPRSVKLGWATGEIGIAVYVGVTMAFLLFFLTEVQNISPVWAGLALLVARLWDVVTDPVMGAISDRTQSRMGRRRPYLLIGSVLFGVSFYFLLWSPGFESETARILYVTLAYILASTAYTIYSVPYSAMAAEMTMDYKERTALTGYKMVAARLGIIFAGAVTPIIYASQETLAAGFELVGLLFGALIMLSGLVAFFTTRQAPRVERQIHSFSLREELAAILRNRPFAILFAVFLLQNLAIGASATTLVYFLTFVMRVDAALIGPLLAVGGITATLMTPPWVVVAKHMGKKRAYVLGLGISAVMALPALFLPPNLYLLLFLVYFLMAIGDAANQLLPNSMVPDTVEVDELHSGRRREGAIFGAWSFCLKLGMAGGAFLVSLGLELFGFQGGNGGMGAAQTEGALLGVRVSYAALPFLLWIAALLVLRKYDLTEDRFNAIKAQCRLRSSESGG